VGQRDVPGRDAVECRVDVCPEPDRATVRIHGRLAGAAVPELERVCLEAAGVLVLDLTYLMSADERGIAMLRRLIADGAQCTGMSGYVTLLLELGSR
jgi:hypothetical protein